MMQGKRGGLKDTLPDDMLAAVFQATLQRTGIDPAVGAPTLTPVSTHLLTSPSDVPLAQSTPVSASFACTPPCQLSIFNISCCPAHGRTLGTSSLAACWATAASARSSAASPPSWPASPRTCPCTPLTGAARGTSLQLRPQQGLPAKAGACQLPTLYMRCILSMRTGR